MSQLAALLREYYERSSFESIADLARSARRYGPLSDSYLKNILQGRRSRPAFDKLMTIARALELDKEDTQRLLDTIGLPPTPPVLPDNNVQRVVEALQQLAETPGMSTESMGLVVDGLVLMIEGVSRGMFTTSPLAKPKAQEASPPLRPLPTERLTQEVGVIDDLLGEILSRDEPQSLNTLFRSLEEAARGERWEVKRRVAEALPKLVQLQPDAALRVAEILREDYHPDYRADIRRRVIEAVPALYDLRPRASLQLLATREKDEVYMAMATVEVLHDMQRSNAITAEVADHCYHAVRVENPLHQDVINFLRQLLAETQNAPDDALTNMNANRSHPERIYKIVIQRTAPRLLQSRPEQVFELMFYFLRRDENGQPKEHQNLRRPVSKALPDILDLLAGALPERSKTINKLLQLLGQDPDIHVRRALSDALDQLVVINIELGVAVLDTLIEDEDPYIRQRAWRILLQLGDLYPEQSADFYTRLLTPN